MKQLSSGCWVKIGEFSGTALYSFDKNSWYSTEEKAREVFETKQAITNRQSATNTQAA
jgi:hypothetical protein